MTERDLIHIDERATASIVFFIKRIYSRSFTAAGIFLLFFFSANAQTNGWYTAKQIGVKTWGINEPGINNNMYLLEGADSALLINAGFGLGNRRDFMKTLSSKPLTVAIPMLTRIIQAVIINSLKCISDLLIWNLQKAC